MMLFVVIEFRCILATDMAKHNDILKSFRAVIQIFDWSAKEHRDLVSIIFITMMSCLDMPCHAICYILNGNCIML